MFASGLPHLGCCVMERRNHNTFAEMTESPSKLSNASTATPLSVAAASVDQRAPYFRRYWSNRELLDRTPYLPLDIGWQFEQISTVKSPFNVDPVSK